MEERWRQLSQKKERKKWIQVEAKAKKENRRKEGTMIGSKKE